MQIVSINKQYTYSAIKVGFNIDEPLPEDVLDHLDRIGLGNLEFDSPEPTVLIVEAPGGSPGFDKSAVAAINATIAEANLAATKDRQERMAMLSGISNRTGLSLDA